MKLSRSPLFYLALAALALVLSGCNSEKKYAANKDTKFLGIMNSSPGSYQHPRPTSFTLSTDEIVNRDNISGDNVSLLWGLVQIKDY